MKKVLIFSESFEPAHKGGGVAQSMVNIIRNLGNRFQFYVFTLNHEYRRPTEVLDVPQNQWLNFEGKAVVFYATRKEISYQLVKDIIRQVEPNIIYLNAFHEWYFVLLPLWLAKINNIQVIQAPRGLLHKGALSIKPTKKKLFLQLFKFFSMHKGTQWHATDKQEVIDIKEIFGDNSKITLAEVIPDLTSYPLTPITKISSQLKLVTISLIAPKKNHSYVLDILQNLDLQIEWDIYGPIYDPKYWEECQEKIKNLPANIQVYYGGSVTPKEVHQVLANYHFFILPTFGENFGHVLYESLNAGRPLIISDKTPWHNLASKKAGWDLPLSQTHLFRKAILDAYYMDQETYIAHSAGAYQEAQNFVNSSNYEVKYRALFA